MQREQDTRLRWRRRLVLFLAFKALKLKTQQTGSFNAGASCRRTAFTILAIFCPDESER